MMIERKFPALLSALPALVFVSHLSPLAADCLTPGFSQTELLELRANGFELENAERRNALGLALASCTGEPDPAIRDGVAFEGLSTWLRADLLSAETVDALRIELSAQLAAESDSMTDEGFSRPFAALILSEVARTDRIEPAFTPEQRAELVSVAAAYLASVDDYRGFSETEGWRHGVAHGADLVLQLVLNPQVSADQIELLMDALARQVSPPGAVFYIYGEPSRLARAVFYAYARGVVEQDYWSNWFQSISSPGPLATWSDAFSSQAGLARRHNTLAFLSAMYLNANSWSQPERENLSGLVIEAIEKIMSG